MQFVLFVCFLLPFALASKYSRLAGQWDLDEFYDTDRRKDKYEDEIIGRMNHFYLLEVYISHSLDFPCDDFEMSDDWRKDVAALEARLTLLEEQFKRKLATDTRHARSNEEAEEWTRNHDYDGGAAYHPQQLLSNNPNEIAPNPIIHPFKPSSDYVIGGPSRDIPYQYLPRDVTGRIASLASEDDLRSRLDKQLHNYDVRGDVMHASNLKTPGLEPTNRNAESPGIPENKDCDSIYDRGMSWNGVYDIIVHGRRVEVYCQFDQEGHNWMIIQRRIDGNVDFYRNWENYKRVFGTPSGEFWIGLENLHQLTSSHPYALRIELVDWEDNRSFAEYRAFSVGDEQNNYRLTLSGYTGNAGDAMSYHNGRPFSTWDRPHDALRSINCAEESHGGWWYNACQRSNLNGRYLEGGAARRDGVSWYYWKSSQYSMKEVTMKIRRV